jgi:hypothetical protein
MPKNRPAVGDSNWGTSLNAHLNQFMPTGGGINFATTRPTLTASDDGYTMVDTVTRELVRWDGTKWVVLLAGFSYNAEAILNQPTLSYPDGLSGVDKIITLSNTATYTVPTGKNLYIHQQTINDNIDGNGNWYSVVYAKTPQTSAPSILSQLAVSATRTISRDFLDGTISIPEGTILSSNVNTVKLSCTEVDKKVDLKLIYLAQGSQYLTTKRFVLNFFGGVDLSIDGGYFDYSSDTANTRRQAKPLILPAGSAITGGPDYNFFNLNNGTNPSVQGCFISGYEV